MRKTVSKLLRNAYGLSVLGAMVAAAGVYDGGGSELLCLKGLESVGGFTGRRVGGAAILVEFTRGRMGDDMSMYDAGLLIPEFLLLDLRPNRPKECILRLMEGELVAGVLIYGELGQNVDGS